MTTIAVSNWERGDDLETRATACGFKLVRDKGHKPSDKWLYELWSDETDELIFVGNCASVFAYLAGMKRGAEQMFRYVMLQREKRKNELRELFAHEIKPVSASEIW